MWWLPLALDIISVDSYMYVHVNHIWTLTYMYILPCPLTCTLYFVHKLQVILIPVLLSSLAYDKQDKIDFLSSVALYKTGVNCISLWIVISEWVHRACLMWVSATGCWLHAWGASSILSVNQECSSSDQGRVGRHPLLSTYRCILPSWHWVSSSIESQSERVRRIIKAVKVE